MPRGKPTLPSATEPPAAAQSRHTPHTQQLSVSPVKEEAPHPTGRAGASKDALPGTGCLVPGKGKDPGKKGVSTIYGGVSLPDFVHVPCFGFPFVWKAFFSEMEHYRPPPGFTTHISLSGRALQSVRPSQWSNSHLLILFLLS